MRHEFDAALWRWESRTDHWFFVTLPREVSDAISDVAVPGRGFGSVPVRVEVGGSRWSTSVFPDNARGAYILPVKKSVRVAEDLAEGTSVRYAVQLRT